MKEYSSYKDSAAQWLGDIPAHWAARKIKTLFRIKKEIAGKDGLDVLSITQQGIKIKDVESNEGQIAQSYTNYQLLNIGEFAMNHMDLLTGWVDISSYNGVTSPDYRVFVRFEELALSRYLLYTLQTCYSRKIFYGLAQGVSSIGRCRLQSSKFKSFVFPLPPTLEEQESIVAYLDKKCAEIEELISRRQSIIERLRELKQSIIAEAVIKGLNPDVPMRDSGFAWTGNIPAHWKIEKLTAHFQFGKGLSITKADLQEKGIPVISYGQIHSKINNGVDVNDKLIRYVDVRYKESAPKALVHSNDIVFADTSEDVKGIGNCVRISYESDIFAGYHTIIAFNKGKVNTKYWAYLFQSDNWRNQLRIRTNGVKVFSISQKNLRRCNLITPPDNEQQSIVAYLDKKCAEIDELISRHERTIEKLKELKASTIAHVVTGKVDVRDAI